MNRLITVLFLATSFTLMAQTAAEQDRVNKIIKSMTLAEKVGQMTQVTLGVVATGERLCTDPALLKRAVQDYKVGSILNVTNHALTQDEWHVVIKQIQDKAMKSRLKIPVIYGLDAMHGQTYTMGSTLFRIT